MKKPRLDLLKALADHLLTVPPERFDMEVWQETADCGFAGCAIGHSMGLPGFEKLKFVPDEFHCRQKEPTYRAGKIEYKNYDAVARFLSIALTDACHLFHPSSYARPTRRNVANRIYKFIKDNG